MYRYVRQADISHWNAVSSLLRRCLCCSWSNQTHSSRSCKSGMDFDYWQTKPPTVHCSFSPYAFARVGLVPWAEALPKNFFKLCDSAWNWFPFCHILLQHPRTVVLKSRTGQPIDVFVCPDNSSSTSDGVSSSASQPPAVSASSGDRGASSPSHTDDSQSYSDRDAKCSGLDDSVNPTLPVVSSGLGYPWFSLFSSAWSCTAGLQYGPLVFSECTYNVTCQCMCSIRCQICLACVLAAYHNIPLSAPANFTYCKPYSVGCPAVLGWWLPVLSTAMDFACVAAYFL